MRVFRIEKSTFVHGSPEAVWDFFSTPLNLNEITPRDMSFEILSELEGQKMYPGMIINYIVRPVLNIPMRWTTEITHCDEGKLFVDEQRFGPYAFWHHKHFFEPVNAELVKMTDVVDYAIGYGFVGRLANSLYIRKKLESIFEYRNQTISNFFPEKNKQAAETL